MTTLRTITGELRHTTGELLPETTIVIAPVVMVSGDGGDVAILGDAFEVTSDESGMVEFEAYEGDYDVEYPTSRGKAIRRGRVDTEGPWTMGRFLGPTGNYTPSLVQQAIDATIDAEQSRISAAASAAAAGVASGRFVITEFSELESKFVDADPAEGQIILPVGGIVVDEKTGSRWERVTTGEHLDYTGTGGVKFTILPTNGIVNITAAGPAADGVTDDAEKLRIAMAALKTAGGGRLLVPDGDYYLSSGDPRGFNMVTVTGVANTWGICEAVDGVEVYGQGRFIINSERLGQRTADSKMDVGAVFSNMRTIANDSTATHSVGYFAVRGVTFEWTDVDYPLRDYVEGQAVNLRGLTPGTSIGEVVIENVRFNKNAGHNAVIAWPVDCAVIKGCHWQEPGFSAASGNTDYSGIYVSGKFCEASGNTMVGSSPDSNTTFLEIHCRETVVFGNRQDGGFTFLNAVPQAETSDPALDGNIFNVYGNAARGIGEFVIGWGANDYQIDSINIHGNDVEFLAAADAQNVSLFRVSLLSSPPLPIRNVNILNNNVRVSYSGSWTSSGSLTFAGIVNATGVERIIVSVNHFYDLPRSVLSFLGPMVKEVDVSNNRGTYSARANDSDQWMRAAVTGSIVNDDALEAVKIKGNNFTNSYGGASLSNGVYITNFADTANVDVDIAGNEFRGNTYLEIQIQNGAGKVFSPNKIFIDHINTAFPAADAYIAALVSAVNVDAIKIGSVSQADSFRVLCIASSALNVTGYGSAAPASRFWQANTIVYNTAPAAAGYIGWVCTTGGIPGTWKGFGEIEA